MIIITKSTDNIKNMACNKHATDSAFLNLIPARWHKKPMQTNQIMIQPRVNVVRQLCLVLLFLTLILLDNAIGQEPVRSTASSRVSASIISRDQMVELGPGDTSSIRSGNGYSRQLSDTIIAIRHLYIVTLNCE